MPSKIDQYISQNNGKAIVTRWRCSCGKFLVSADNPEEVMHGDTITCPECGNITHFEWIGMRTWEEGA